VQANMVARDHTLLVLVSFTFLNRVSACLEHQTNMFDIVSIVFKVIS
jgi:hypothetical protein